MKSLTELIRWTGIIILVCIILFWFENGFTLILQKCLHLL
jgi:hypothetical protein